MQFFERIPGAERERLMAAGRSVELARGEYLLRRGERGGDIYLVEEGTLEVVDTRSSPEVVISLVGPGAVVGEMAFIDEAPRNADVRAAGPAVCRHWEHDLLMRVLEEDPSFGRAFFQALAATAVARLRDMSSTAVVGGIGGGDRLGEDLTTTTVLNKRTLRLSARARDGFLDADARLRRDSEDEAAAQLVKDTFAELVEGASEGLSGREQAEQTVTAGLALARELRPYFVRSRAGQLATEPPEGHAGGSRLMAHILRGRPEGDGAFGRLLDDCILRLPTSGAFRRRSKLAARTLLADVHGDRVSVLVVPAGAGGTLPRIHDPLMEFGANITAVDGSREALGRLKSVLPTPPVGSQLRLLHEDLATLVNGRSELRPEPQDVIVVDGLTEYLPDRMVAALCRWCLDSLLPGGELLITGVGPSADAAVFDHLLQWPLVRREAQALRALVEAAGLRAGVVAGSLPEDGPAVLVRGRRV